MGECCCGEARRQDADELEELLNVDKLSIRILTWNVAGQQPNSSSISKLLKQNNNESNILVIGLQEIIDINSAKNMIIDDDTDKNWENIILQTLNTSNKLSKKKGKSKRKKSKKNATKYTKLKSVRLMGVLLLVYVQQRIQNDIRDLMSNKCGAGLFGIAPNKGGVGIRFDIYNTSICFICAHLAANKQNIQDRNDNYNKIMSKLTFQRESDDSNEIKINEDDLAIISIQSHDLIFFCGDLNYRLDFDELDTVYNLIEKQEWNKLLIKDQLLTQMEENKAFDGFKENRITFQPTYKYEIGGSEYDKVKGRIPSFCDRILWKINTKNRGNQNKKVQCLQYDSLGEILMSDHKPVIGLFQIKFQMYL